MQTCLSSNMAASIKKVSCCFLLCRARIPLKLAAQSLGAGGEAHLSAFGGCGGEERLVCSLRLT